MDVYWKLIHLCEDFNKAVELLQLCISANNKRYVNAAIAWALHKSVEQFCALVYTIAATPQQKLTILSDVMNLQGQLSSKQYGAARLKIQSLAVYLYGDAFKNSAESDAVDTVTFDVVCRWYKTSTSTIGVKRSSPTADNPRIDVH